MILSKSQERKKKRRPTISQEKFPWLSCTGARNKAALGTSPSAISKAASAQAPLLEWKAWVHQLHCLAQHMRVKVISRGRCHALERCACSACAAECCLQLLLLAIKLLNSDLNSGIHFVGLESHPLPGDTCLEGEFSAHISGSGPSIPSCLLPATGAGSSAVRALRCSCHGPFSEPSQALNKYLSAEPSGVLSDGMCVFSTLIGVRQSRDSRSSLLRGQRLAHSQRQH